MPKVLSTSSITGRLAPSFFTFSFTVMVKSSPSTLLSSPFHFFPSASSTSTSFPMKLRYCCLTLKGCPRPALPTSNS